MSDRFKNFLKEALLLIGLAIVAVLACAAVGAWVFYELLK